MSNYTISQNGIQAIKDHEQLRLNAYNTDGAGIWTIGYGHTGKVNGKPITSGMTITPEQAEQLLIDDLKRFEKAVNNNVKVPLNQAQYDALVSFSFNIGDGNFKESTLLRRLNQGDYQAAADQMLIWNKGGGKVLKGLERRRANERAMFLGNDVPVNPTMPKPTSVDEEIDAPIRPLQNFTQPLTTFTTEEDEAYTAPAQTDLTPAFTELNSTINAFAPPETLTDFQPPEQPDYSEKLAAAFGITPSTKGKIPPHIDDMIRSIYEQTA